MRSLGERQGVRVPFEANDSVGKLLEFRGADTHGLKAFRRASVLPILERCIVERDVFASELVIRAYRAGLDVHEIPIRVAERRAQSINLLARITYVLRRLTKLTWAIRLSRPAPARHALSAYPADGRGSQHDAARLATTATTNAIEIAAVDGESRSF